MVTGESRGLGRSIAVGLAAAGADIIGVSANQPEHIDEDWDTVLEVNLTAPFVLARELGTPMLARGHGKVIFVSSILGFQGGVTVLGDASTKSAIIGLTTALANEWAGRGVDVNAVAPGYTRTDNTQVMQDDTDRSAAIRERIPAGDWQSRTTSLARRCSSPHRHRTTSTAASSRSTVGGWAAARAGRRDRIPSCEPNTVDAGHCEI